ncbi:MAG: hypothetical protein F7B20_06475 [Aeropyrum sp.]|nr:hypothetical protein [Aeropyrum sp.]MCE4616324.1 hypothetical protein [Aeropyrum sp.]
MGSSVACFSSPHHITALFRAVKGPSPSQSGSIGVGLAVSPRARLCLGVEGEVGYPTPPHYTIVARRLGVGLPAARVSSPLPPGVGYAVSAASAVLGALAASYLGRVPLLRALRVAHSVEVEMSTGLGDVSAIGCGLGLVVRHTPGPPGLSEVDCIPIDGSLVVVSGERGPMPTGELIGVYSSERVMSAVSRALGRVLRDPSLDRMLEEAGYVARELGLDRILVGVDGSRVERLDGVLGFYVKKRMIVVVADARAAGRVSEVLSGFGLRVRLLSPSGSPPSMDLLW